jgi:MerR family transcriptional regulator, copper efflux regulator
MASHAMNIRETYVRVTEAAEILGVVPNTVRKWGAAGKIPEYRHPANGYRLYKRDELAAFIRQIEPNQTHTKPKQ